MMHTCPNCDRMCDCDGEDSEVMTREWVARNCQHDCEDEDDEMDGGWAISPDHSDSLWDEPTPPVATDETPTDEIDAILAERPVSGVPAKEAGETNNG